ncbi:ArsC/Spx/MgsR family protein [Bartonella sp. DGB2]|uniref:ArsC/Spx/MgsR family protein n=1 Tax=Bartonella sp. DGB2 TaxID=3388426 RepID=UPI00398FF4BC
MQKVLFTLYHNPRCSKSRAALAALTAHGIEPEIVEYLKVPLVPMQLLALAEKAKVPFRTFLRTKEPLFAALSLDDLTLTPEALAQIVCAHPELLNRPIIVGPKGAGLARDEASLAALLP